MHKGVRSRREYREKIPHETVQNLNTSYPQRVLAMKVEVDGIEFGHRYRDPYTGFEGVAVAVYVYEHSCPRVNLRKLGKEGTLLESAFDAPGLQPATTTPATISNGQLGFSSADA